ncbi:ACP S-malonyltransferase [Aurantiacibacter atlanticus]|uniref:Malonyl CoA-acyl carrier protein transacylase n=1 Tax=Aurantiacibacter atlanticus TaxID=1648404 RepID=A0A0H4VK80_9SPHN|nr:ACP S-malonyltransferase [Aurantiacibacter atlanticus]AKQ43281.1 ACP S-malonyltransferase [Aurantiacibacter atlanticus]MDF1836204.1 ACP S-malonyltransferase [Alteraurantiacibacter sp. bin_em_oilr2.035]
MIAFVFPGQGSQKVGMGVELAEASSAAREVFEEVDEALKQKLSALMRDGPESELTMTANAQPAIMANALAVARVLEDGGVSLSEKGEAVAGHSLGEYSALASVGAFSLTDTAKLLRLRGIAMQDAVPIGLGAMCALLGADLEKAQKLADAAAQGQVCEVANDNDPGQVVLSGHAEAIDRAVEMAKEYGCKRAIKLPVSAPFHCSLMQPAAQRMKLALENTPPQAFRLPVYANVTATPITDADTQKGLLVEQITGRVRWRECVIAMQDSGINHFVELGGKVLGPMIRKIAPDVAVTSVVGMDDIEAFAKEL